MERFETEGVDAIITLQLAFGSATTALFYDNAKALVEEVAARTKPARK